MNNLTEKDYIELAHNYAKTQNYSSAIKNYKKAIALNPDKAETYKELANIYSILKEYDKAIEYYLKSIEIEPNYYLAHNNVGQVYRKQGQFEKAKEYYIKAINIDADNCMSLVNLGQLFYDEKDYDNAIKYLTKTVNLVSEELLIDIYCILGASYIEKAQYENAMEYCLKVLEINPDDTWAKFSLEFTYNKQKKNNNIIENEINLLDTNKSNDKKMKNEKNKTTEDNINLLKTEANSYKKTKKQIRKNTKKNKLNQKNKLKNNSEKNNELKEDSINSIETEQIKNEIDNNSENGKPNVILNKTKSNVPQFIKPIKTSTKKSLLISLLVLSLMYILYYFNSTYIQLIELAKIEKNIFKTPFPVTLQLFANQNGLIFENYHNLEKDIIFYEKVIDNKLIDDKKSNIVYSIKLINFLRSEENYTEAIKYGENALNLLSEKNNTSDYLDILIELAQNYSKLEKFNKAETYYNKAQSIINRNKVTKLQMYDFLLCKARMNEDKRKFDKAEEIYLNLLDKKDLFNSFTTEEKAVLIDLTKYPLCKLYKIKKTINTNYDYKNQCSIINDSVNPLNK
ncbi:MAG: tetratricopeptide repeat protein [bacterium]